jgi:hypothetical protein
MAKDLGGEDIVGLVLGFETVAQKEPYALAPAWVSRSLSRIYWNRLAPFSIQVHRRRRIVVSGSRADARWSEPVIINPKMFLEQKSITEGDVAL